MTSENLEKILEEHTRKILLKSHPIGSIEIRTDDINPGTIYGCLGRNKRMFSFLSF